MILKKVNMKKKQAKKKKIEPAKTVQTSRKQAIAVGKPKTEKYSRFFLYLVVFGSGISVLAIELAASRLLAPYFGISIFVWGNIIGMILIALSLGYWIGGKLADKHPTIEFLMYIMAAAGVLTSLIPVLFQLYIKIMNVNLSFIVFLIVGSLLAVAFLFFIPVFLLGMVSPFAIRIMLSDIKSSGAVAGSLYAFSTVGSIVGTFLSAFILIPFWGTKETIYLASIVLLLLAGFGLRKKPVFFLLMLVPIGFYFITIQQNIKEVAGLVYEQESPYQFFQVFKRDERYELRVNDGLGLQSIYDPNSVLVNNYYDYYSVLPYFNYPNRKKDILLIDLGGGTISREYLAFFGDRAPLNIDGIEIDPGVIKAGQQFFDLAKQNINIHVSDGRSYLQQTDKNYDIMIVDAYSQQLYIPFHLTTQEFFLETKNHLQENGILAMNVNAVSRDSILLNRIIQTLHSVYSHTYLSPLGEGYNWLVLASASSLDLARMKASIDQQPLIPIANEVISGFEEIESDSRFQILTDNKAPIELLTEKEILDYLLNEI